MPPEWSPWALPRRRLMRALRRMAKGGDRQPWRDLLVLLGCAVLFLVVLVLL